jgi:hypothetical protein
MFLHCPSVNSAGPPPANGFLSIGPMNLTFGFATSLASLTTGYLGFRAVSDGRLSLPQPGTSDSTKSATVNKWRELVEYIIPSTQWMYAYHELKKHGGNWAASFDSSDILQRDKKYIPM